MLSLRFTLPLLAAAALAGCKEKEKAPTRTEPWPAPALSVSSAVQLGDTIAYELEAASVELELRGKRARATGKLVGFEGTVELDPSVFHRSRGHVRFDLSTLELASSDPAPEADPAVMLAALRALELTADRPAEQRERVRWAEARITGFDRPPDRDESAPRGRKTAVRAYADVTLHRFRVPMTLELEVELEPASGGGLGKLRVRTRRPVTIPLPSHDILPRDASGTVTLTPPSGFGGEVPREVRVSAELTFRAAKTDNDGAETP